jgi:putative peptide zinc metalloprotease protein
LGHASALKFFNKRCGEIGFGIYITIPALYTDVTQAWGLKRWQRVVVDIGGMYFQSLYLIPIMLYNLYIPLVEIHYIIVAILFSFLMNLNPLFKFDGYWILSDALGITNLRQKSNNVFSNLIQRKNPKELTYLSDFSTTYKTFIYIYMIASNLFLAYFIVIVIPNNLFNIDYRSIAGLIMDDEGLTIYGMTQLIFLSFMCFILYKLVKPYFSKVISKI